MRAPFASLAELSSALAAVDVSLADLVPDAEGSLRRLAKPAPPLPPLADLTAAAHPELVLRAPLAQGGMGQVMAARQASVGREVALKRAVPGVLGTIAKGELVAEGRVAGRLEHPNIVPVHLLGTTGDGAPCIVMQRIDGETWADVLARGRDLLRDVDILIAVCRGLHFAHERGVVHRDVKPKNVMLGRYGEVFLLDWGIAVGFGPHAPPELPRADDVREVAGTPQYMAPEMVAPPTSVDPRTDVHLVGAVLYELVTGAPPRAHGDVASALLAAQVGAPPPFPADAPEELVAICTRAMAREPAQRFATVEDVRLALTEFVRHAEARLLCERAESRLAVVVAGDDARSDTSSDGSSDGSSDAAIRRAYIECRFAFAQALKSWPGSQRARSGLAAATAAMTRREIAAGRHGAAALIAAELDASEHELRAALAAELAALQAKLGEAAAGAEALKRFAIEHDSRTAARERALVLLGAASGFLVLMCGCAFLAARGVWAAGAGTFAITLAVFSAAFVAAAIFVPALRATEASRQLMQQLCASEIGFTSAYFAAWRFDVALAPTLALAHCCMALFAASYATRDPRIWRGVAIAVLIVPAIVLLPAQAYLVSGIGTFLTIALGGLHLWWLPRRTPAEAA